MSEIILLVLWLVCIGFAFWADIDAQKHIEKGWDES